MGPPISAYCIVGQTRIRELWWAGSHSLVVYLMSQSWDNVASMHDHLLTVHAHKT